MSEEKTEVVEEVVESVPENTNEVEEVVEEPVFTDEELQAMDHGWAPKDQWKGDESDWVSAKEFNRRGELFGKIKNLERDRDTNRQALQHMKDLLAKAKETEYNRAMRELKAEKKAAAEEGETTKMLEIDDQIEELQADHQDFQINAQQVPDTSYVNDRFIEWQQKNQWYTADPEMRAFADTYGQTFAQQNPGTTPDAIFNAVDKQIRKAYPEKFQNPKRSSPPKVEETTQAKSGGKKSKYSIKDLDDSQRSIMETMVRSGVMSQEEYIEELARIGEIG